MSQKKVPFRTQHFSKTMHSTLYGFVIKVDQHVTTEDYVNCLLFNNLFQLKKVSLGKTCYLGEDLLYLQSFIAFSEIAFEMMGRRRLECSPRVNSVFGSLYNLWININPFYFNIPIPEKAP